MFMVDKLIQIQWILILMGAIFFFYNYPTKYNFDITKLVDIYPHYYHIHIQVEYLYFLNPI
jgi:hypothetical protein